jgi:hemerythrin
MEKIEWTKNLQLGIDVLDRQHKDVIAAMAAAVGAAEGSAGKKQLIGLFDKLRDILMKHFETEEKLMDNSDYPDIDGHKVLHGEFMEEFEDILYKAGSGETGPKFAQELKENVADWFILHIQKNDLKMAPYIVEK